jgi:A/G-specific adenine glycosylase
MPTLAAAILDWYAAHQRPLPWRASPTPYTVWVSEIMAQQTRLDTVLPYYERWLARFPDIPTLAAAEQREVLNLWEGLGYYSRARRLHRAAQIVMSELGGALPADPAALRRLPGIGAYTAGAIASLAFRLDEPVVDGNVRRVLARVFDLQTPADSPAGMKELWALARRHLPPGRAADYNQGLMELGALVCTPKNPACGECPLNQICLANRHGTQAERPVLKPKSPVPHLTVTAGVIAKNGKVLIAQRPPDGLLGGLWEFPGGKLIPGESLPQCLAREIEEELGLRVEVGAALGVYRHAYTHFKVTLHAFGCRLRPVGQRPRRLGVADFKWVRPAELSAYPMGKIDRQIAAQVQSA